MVYLDVKCIYCIVEDPAAPELLQILSHNITSLTFSWTQAGITTNYSLAVTFNGQLQDNTSFTFLHPGPGTPSGTKIYTGTVTGLEPGGSYELRLAAVSGTLASRSNILLAATGKEYLSLLL